MFDLTNTIFLMRHAQSNLPNFRGPDFDRPLDPYGETQPFITACKLNSLGIQIKHALLSPARRTTQTFELLTQKLITLPESLFDKRLYNAPASHLQEILLEHAKLWSHILLIGHNPGLGELVFNLSGAIHAFKPADLIIIRAQKKNLYEALQAPKSFTIEKILS